ncbi:MAG: Transcriptional regulator, LysR family protein [uncultured bacterium]|nr:MAG: Transcriptional regulator, LysR family protein [uncultured bacterium]
MHEMNIKKLDLNLLIALKALLEEKHVSRAAERIGLSQPAMSRALAKLRRVLNDPLLVKGANGLDLSARASDLYQPLLNILSEIHRKRMVKDIF